MSKIKNVLFLVTTALTLLYCNDMVSAQELTASNLNNEGKVDKTATYTEDGQDYYSVKGKADKKQTIYILADTEGNDSKHYSVISKVKANKNGNYSTYLASVESEDAIYYLSTDKTLDGKKKDETFDIDSINSKIKVIIPPIKGTEIKDSSNYEKLSYKDISKNTKKYKDKDLVFSGTVLQVIDDSTVLLSVDDNPKEVLYLYLSSPVQKNSSFSEDDPITVYGKLKGMETYKNTKNKDVKAPLFYVLKTENEQPSSEKTAETTASSEEKNSSSQVASSSTSSKKTSSKKPKKKVNKQKQVNKDIAAGLKQAKGWANGELDGDGNPTDDGTPNEDWAWANYIDKIEYSSDKSGEDKKLYIHVYKGFLNLSKKERTSIMRSAMRFTYSYIQKYYKLDQYEDVHQGISTNVIDDTGVPIGMSKVSDHYDFKWFE